jgi:hypothetical protein
MPIASTPLWTNDMPNSSATSSGPIIGFRDDQHCIIMGTTRRGKSSLALLPEHLRWLYTQRWQPKFSSLSIATRRAIGLPLDSDYAKSTFPILRPQYGVAL